MTEYQVLSDGQFVYGPNMRGFVLQDYLELNAPHLSSYAGELYGRAEYYSINPRIYLTMMEMRSQAISMPKNEEMQDFLGLKTGDLNSQIEYLSDAMLNAYYLHINVYTSLPVAQRKLEPLLTPSGSRIVVSPETNAGTYAIIAGFAALDVHDLSAILDRDDPNGFFKTYVKLFGVSPINENNSIYGNVSMASPAVPPATLLQLPFLRGLSWKFGGVHDTSGGGGVGTPLNDASSLDFYPSGSVWNIDTSNMWVVAAASGIPTKFSACGFKVSHSGIINQGWETTYYHLENIQNYAGSININDKIGVIANTLAEAVCTGGSASGPHVHFSLKYNGVYVAINGTALSGWYVNCTAGNGCLTNYDVNPSHMWIERGGIKKYPFNSFVLSEAPPLPLSFIISGNTGVDGVTLSYLDGTTKTVVSGEDGSYSITVPYGWTGIVVPIKPYYEFSPAERVYSSIVMDYVSQNYTATVNPVISGTVGVSGVTLSYTDGTAKTVTSAADGSYSFSVPAGWTGTLTPTHTCYTFSPVNRVFSVAVATN